MIQVSHLTKCYDDLEAVKDLSFTIEDGHVYGFLGPNGAGKSTTMNMMTGCLSATSGTVKIDGYDIFEDAREAKRRIGYLPEQPPLYMNETPREYLRFVGMAKGLREPALSEEIQSVLEQTKTEAVQHRQIRHLSKGYKQRVGIAQALLGNPRVIILDEPTVGLDPIQIIEIRDLIRQLGQEHTVILSSHILSEVQTLCEKILIIAGGQLQAFDTPENLEERMKHPDGIFLTTEADPEAVRAILETVEGVTSFTCTEKEYTEVQLRVSGEELYRVSRELFFAFSRAEKALLELRLQKANLEDIFLELTEAGPEEATEMPEPPTETEETDHAGSL